MIPDDVIVRLNAAATVLFLATTSLAAALFDRPFTTLGVVVDLCWFSAGVVAFLWGYWSAVQRSRHEEISVAGMYFLLGGCAPVAVARWMNLLLAAQVTVGLVGALVRPATEGRAGSTLAFGILVPMLGLGLNGLWASHRGTFPPRMRPADGEVTHSDSPTGQDESHD